MSDKKGRIEFGRSGEFKVKVTDEKGSRYEDLYISAGKHYSCEKIFHWNDGYSDVYFSNGSVLEKISLNDLSYSCAFGEHGHVLYEDESKRIEGEYPLPHEDQEESADESQDAGEEAKVSEFNMPDSEISLEESSQKEDGEEKPKKRGWL